jgi:predicted neuraminidase
MEDSSRPRIEFIFDQSTFASCHASTVAATPAGLVAAWFGGPREYHPLVGIWLARHDGNNWSSPVEVANGVQYTQADGQLARFASWNPVLHQVPDGPLMLFYKVGVSPQTWWGMLMTSSDHGVSWSQPVRLPEGILGPIKNKPLQLADGTLLCPSSTETTMATGWRVHFERTEDFGRTWSRTEPVNPGEPFGAIQPSLLAHPGGRLQAVGRTQLAKRIFSTWSEDGGHTWSEMELLDLPNPDAGTDAVTMRDGRHVIIYNHCTSGRSPINLALSADGRNWKTVLELESNEEGELSYPAIIQGTDGLLHATYTWKRQRIRHVVVDPARLA